MLCFICKKEVVNNCCIKCELNYRNEKIVLDRHCWNLEDYITNVKKSIKRRK